MSSPSNRLALLATLALSAACASSGPGADPRVGLKPGMLNAGEAASNLKVTAKVQPPTGFMGATNSDLAFTGNYVIEGNYNGPVIWDISNPSSPQLVSSYACPASQNDVSVYRNLLFMSVESNSNTLDCKTGVRDTVSSQRMRGIRIFDISDIRSPKLIHSVQTCRGSHTHTVLEDPRDKENVYIYVSGSAGMRSPTELPDCVRDRPDSNPSSALWRIEVIKVPLANPTQAAIVNRANIFTGLKAAATHGPALEDTLGFGRRIDSLRKAGGFIANDPNGSPIVLGSGFTRPMLDSIVKARGGTGAPTAADSTTLRTSLQGIVDRLFGVGGPQQRPVPGVSPISVNRQCHDITVYPALGLAGGACEGHGLLLDISDPVNPRRIAAVSDSNFAYWHSATFNNDGTKILFTDEWGGGGAPKCRATDKKEWGSDAIFEIVNGRMEFRSYYKLSAPQTTLENCVAHNGSLIPIPGRDVMVQAWYQGGISVFDWTDARNPIEIAYHDRGPVDSTRMAMAGSWSAYWYNGAIVSNEIARGLDLFELTPSEHLTQNEIDAARTVKLSYLNVQGQPKFSWPPSFPLARAYLDQLERKKCLPSGRVAAVRKSLADAEAAAVAQRQSMLAQLATQLEADKAKSCDAPRLSKLQQAVNDLSRPMVP